MALQEISNKMWVWRLAIVKGCMYSLLTLITAFTTGVADCDFPSLTPWNKSLIILGVLSSWLLTMMAFLDKTIAAIKEESKQEQQKDTKTT